MSEESKKLPAAGESAAPGKLRVDPTVPAAAEPAADRKLTPEEQMALYEKDLRENDWGHQPC